MRAAEAIAAVADHIRRSGIDYPTNGLATDRFEAGWAVYAPVQVDTSSPQAFLNTSVGRAVFLIGDSGRIEQVSSAEPPLQAQRRFADQERAQSAGTGGYAGFFAEFRDGFDAAAGPDSQTTLTMAGPQAGGDAAGDAEIREQASTVLDDVARQIAALAPTQWQEFRAEFAFTVRDEIAAIWFATPQGVQPAVRAPAPVLDAVRRQRDLSARMSAGPWWRLILGVTHDGQLSVSYDYGDDPFPESQLQPAQNYRDDLAAYPRPGLPTWLAAYLAGPQTQGRDPRAAEDAARRDSFSGRSATPTDDIEPLPETWSRWAVLAAVYVGARSQWGPRIGSGVAVYESESRSGSTLFVLPGERAVLSGGRWDSPLLTAAYRQSAPLPDLYAGAPSWVNDTVLNTRNRNGLLSFCYWWTDGQWWRGGTDTFDELDAPLPVIWTPEETVDAMTAVVGPDAAPACRALLSQAERRAVQSGDVAAAFEGFAGPDLEAALGQLAMAGLTA